jgi:hypothetical protein
MFHYQKERMMKMDPPLPLERCRENGGEGIQPFLAVWYISLIKSLMPVFDKQKNSNYSIFRQFRIAPEGGFISKRSHCNKNLKRRFLF